MKRRKVFAPIILAALVCGPSAWAQTLAVDAPWSDYSFIQRGKPILVAGTALAGKDVQLKFQDKEIRTKAGPNGRWQLELPATTQAGGPFALSIRCEDQSVNFGNLLVGDIWICAGQSNMEFFLQGALNGPKEIREANCPSLRLLHLPRLASATPGTDIGERWQLCTPETAPRFSAVAYFFGRELATKTGIPIGLIEVAWGGRPGQAFMRREAVAAQPQTAEIVKNWDDYLIGYPQALKAYQATEQAQMAQWETARQTRQAQGLRPVEKPAPPPGPDSGVGPGSIWNAMLSPLTKIPIDGAIWYQGEANSAFADQYRSLLPALIADWRSQWGQGDFPFYIVQLANFRPAPLQPGESKFAELREAQSLSARLPNNGLAVTIDVGDAARIHSRNKQAVGDRLALLALHRVYGQSVVDEGPSFEGMEIKGDDVLVRFRQADGLHTSDGTAVKGFAVAGNDRIFHWAKAEIEGPVVRLNCPEVPAPVAVRYAWADNPPTNLYNSANLPAEPFRTDLWPGLTTGKSWKVRKSATLGEESPD